MKFRVVQQVWGEQERLHFGSAPVMLIMLVRGPHCADAWRRVLGCRDAGGLARLCH